MDFTIIIKIAGIALVIAFLNQLLQKAGKEEYILLLTLAGLLIAFMAIIPELNELKDALSSVIEI
ncbi:MAG: stage III sporulation protein AC [Clostridia bacterium]|nr:stage III sporulation protein AC [Clostridia bacterium]